ncbi:MFS transporter [Streptomyces purpureus]|uniref:MFS transporter n=1 Tax=Streptomyces purpureus TaxID=1951 RepID=UPI00039986C3|nr:MFS transporter [Streptomyces purpureus]
MPGSLRLYLAVAFLARCADEGMAVAMALLALERTGSAAEGAFVLTAWMAPHVLAAPLAGALAGRVRRPALFHVPALAGFAVAVVALAALAGRAPLPVVLAVAVVGGCCGPVVSGGLSGLLAALVPDGSSRDRAYALDATVYNAASVAGPAFAGLTAGAVTPAASAALLGAGAAGSAVLAAVMLRGQGHPAATGAPTLGADLAAGLAAVWRVRELRAITAATTLAFFGLGGLTTVAVLLSAERGRPGDGGFLMTAFAVGALVGSAAVARWWPGAPAPRLAGIGLLGTGCALGAAALVPVPALTWALFALAGLCDGPLLGATLRIRADHAPARLRPQVFTIGAGLKISAAACGAAAVGLAATAPPAPLLFAAAAVQLAAAVLHFLLRTPRGLRGVRAGWRRYGPRLRRAPARRPRSRACGCPGPERGRGRRRRSRPGAGRASARR